jgi:ABC-type uncharacterized transport system permease subunit
MIFFYVNIANSFFDIVKTILHLTSGVIIAMMTIPGSVLAQSTWTPFFSPKTDYY